MINQQLLDYVKAQIAQGVNKDIIKQNLFLGGGWNSSDIDDVFKSLGTSSVPNAQNPAGAVPVAPVKYAGFWIRWVALIIDALVVGVGGFFVGVFLGILLMVAGVNLSSSKVIGNILGVLLSWLYFCLMTYYKGATLGKMMVGIRVQSADGQKLSVGQVILRETVGKIISGIIIYVGFIMAAFTDRKRALHDMMAKTVVVYKDPSKPHTAGLVIGIILACILPIIAIIGILSSIVLVSLNVARQKGTDAQMTTTISEMRTQLEADYDKNNQSYTIAHDCSSGAFASDPSFATLISSLKSPVGLACYAEGQTYAISAALSSSGQNYCVDSTAFSGNGVAVDTGTKALCQSRSSSVSDVNIANQTPTVVDNLNYSYTLPTGWTSELGGKQASNINLGYVLEISATQLPQNAGSVTSINQVMNSDTDKAMIKSKYPNATITSVSSGYVGKEEAIITQFGVTLNNTGSQARPVSITEYDVIHKGAFYGIVFIAGASENNVAEKDFQAIISSFTFK